MNKIQKSASHINLMFLIALLPGLIACTFMIGRTSASPVKLSYNICDKVYYDTFVGQVNPKYEKMCRNRWVYLTNSIKRSFINYQK